MTDTVQPPPQPPAAAQHALPPVQRDHQRRIQVAEFVIKLSACVGIPWLLFLWQQQAIPNVLTLLVFVTANVLLLLPMRWGHHYVARVIWVCLAACLCLTITLLFGRDESLGHPEVMFFAVLAFPFLLFSWELERRTMIALIVLVASLALLAMVSNFLPHGKSFISATIPQMDPGAAAKSQFLLRVTVSSILLAELSYFAYLTRLSAQEAAAALQTSQSAAQAKGDFLANMSHEIRTPMNGLIGMLEVLEAMGVSARQAPTIGTIRNSAFSLLRIIDDILDTSKIEAGKLDIEMTKVEIIPLIEGVTQTLRPLADSTGVRLRLFIDPQIPEWVISDAGRLRQILLNLISNSVKFSNRRLIDKEGMVIIRVLRPDDDGIRFEILDNGIGMDQALMDRLFQPFSQGEASRALQMSSTGLGLVITKNLIDLLGGSIEVESAVDAGTRMVVDLPMKVANGPGRMPDISGLTIICFDLPDIDIRTGLQMMLQRTAADVHFVTSIQAVLPLKSKLRAAPIILLPTDVAALADELQRTLERLFPQASFIRFSSERTARYGLVNDRTYLLQIFPLMMTDFIRCIAVLGGRMEPERPVMASPKDTRYQTSRLPPGETARLLIVEDNEINRLVLSKQLELLGYDYAVAIDGAEGFQLWQRGGFDLVLSDCHMPNVDGFEMTALIREAEAKEHRHPTPIIAVTANALEGEAERCLAAGMDGYLAKPVELESLREKLATFLSPAE